MDHNQLLSTIEAAARLNIHPETLKRWRAEGRSPAYVKLAGKAVRYRASDIEAWISNSTVSPLQVDARPAA